MSTMAVTGRSTLVLIAYARAAIARQTPRQTPLATRGVFSTQGSDERRATGQRQGHRQEGVTMRYEFDRNGIVVASVLWEGPGQVTVETADSSTRAVVDRYLSSEVVYMGGGFGLDED